MYILEIELKTGVLVTVLSETSVVISNLRYWSFQQIWCVSVIVLVAPQRWKRLRINANLFKAISFSWLSRILILYFGFLHFFNKALFVLKSALLIQFIDLKRTDVEQIWKKTLFSPSDVLWVRLLHGMEIPPLYDLLYCQKCWSPPLAGLLSVITVHHLTALICGVGCADVELVTERLNNADVSLQLVVFHSCRKCLLQISWFWAAVKPESRTLWSDSYYKQTGTS